MALKWAVREMEDRYRNMSQLGVRNIEGFNEKLREAKEKNLTLKRRVQTGFDPATGQPIMEDQAFDLTPLPYIVFIIDEMADLMGQCGKEADPLIQRLAQMARAVGIHLILATQRPSVDVVTGTIKSNFPSRISFQVRNKIDSRTILDENGAEKLLGYGDMLIKALNIYRNVERVQGAYIPDQDVKKITAYIKEHNKAYFDRAAEKAINAQPVQETQANEERTAVATDLSEEQLFIDALQSVIVAGQASISMLRRRFGLGYAKAGQLIDKMEQMGFVSPFQGSKSRPVLISQEEFDERYGNQEQ
jgi:S-DNA-T family DNA segregation ATPase FtsK/SpoIIIE